MSSVGILAWKSALENGAPFEMPDFRSEEARTKYENDTWNPFLKEGMDKKSVPPCSIIGYEPKPEDVESARKVWEKSNYRGLE